MNSTAETAMGIRSDARVHRSVLLGGLLSGLSDFCYATFKTVSAGGAWIQPWKGVASGLLGKAAREGGVGTAALGIALHFFICLAAAALLYLLATTVKWLPRQWFVLGILYGIAFLAVMNYLILPLSAIGHGIYPIETIHVTAFFHILLVGWPTAFFVSRALKR